MRGKMMIWKFYKNGFYLYVAEHGPELNYIVGTIINTLTDKIRSNGSVIKLSPLALTGVTVSWNYIDAIYGNMLAINQFADWSNYHLKQNILKGVVTVLSGIQAFVFTYNPPLCRAIGLKRGTSLAGSSFALSTLFDLSNTSLDFYYAIKETYFKGWLDERISELNFSQGKGFDTKELIENMSSRCKAYVNNDPDRLSQIIQLLKLRVPDTVSLELLIKDLDKVSIEHKERDLRIQNEVNSAYKTNRTTLCMKGISFVGMTLLAVSGFLEQSSDSFTATLTIGLALTTLVASDYCVKNIEIAQDTVGSIANRFFSAIRNVNCTVPQLTIEDPHIELPETAINKI